MWEYVTFNNFVSTVNSLPANTPDTAYEICLQGLTQNQCNGDPRSSTKSALHTALESITRYIKLLIANTEFINSTTVWSPIDKITLLYFQSETDSTWDFPSIFVNNCPNLYAVWLVNKECLDAEESDSIIYNKNVTTLQFCPPKRKGSIKQIPSTCTIIGSSAFKNCTEITDVTLPNSIQEIQYSAFSGCTQMNLTSSTEGLRIIGEAAFYNCLNLTRIPFSYQLQSIGNSAFKGCTSLTAYNGGYSLTALGDSAFEDCTSLSSVDFSRVTTLGQKVFKNCSALSSFEKSASLTQIPNSAFEGCTSLASFDFQGIARIGDSAFKNSALNGNGTGFLYIPNTVETIGDYAFYGTDIVNVALNAQAMGASAFENCTSLYYVSFVLSSIPSKAFANCTNLNDISFIHANITSIGTDAFLNTNNLTSVLLQASTESMNNWVSIDFANASANPLHNGIAKLYINDEPVASPVITTDEIKPYAFYNYKHLESLEFHGTTIAETALTGCTNLTSVTLKGQPTSLANVFKDLTGLQTVNTVPSSVTNLENAFSGCTALTAIHDWQVNTSLSSVNMTNCFAGCTSLTDIFVKFPQVATEQSKWHLVVFDITSTTPPYRCKIYSSDLDSNGNFVVERDDIYFYPDITLFNEVDEFAGASAITDDELKVLLKAKYPLAYYRDRNVLDPTQKSFILWAKNKQSISTNLFDVGISLSDSDFEEII